ncbi:MAG TPA: DoxX family protein [Polyangiaceae bacterium]|jgi:putative oxidoreductase
MGLLEVARSRVMDVLGRIQWLAPLIGRIAVGLLFVSTGWGKVHDVPKVVHFFEQLGIPAPGFHAVLVSYTELVGGSLIVIGLLTRLACVPLMISMVVAILTAKRADLHGLFDLVGFDEFTYLCVLAMIVIIGPGSASIDALIVPKLFPARHSAR